jgi:hypothetical protein
MELTEAPVQEAADATPPPPPPNSSKAAWIVAGVATAVALVAAMFAVSGVMQDKNDNANGLNAAGFNAAGFNRPVGGTIQSIKGSSFTVKETGFNGQTTTTQVDTNDKTTFREMVSGALSDLKVGDSVAVTGTTADNVFTATQISETTGQVNVVRGGGPQFNSNAAPPQGFRNGDGDIRVGEISKVEGDTITLNSFDGTAVTVKTTANTKVRVSKTIALKNLKVGDTVRVFGTTNGNKLTATEVTKGAGDGPLGA